MSTACRFRQLAKLPAQLPCWCMLLGMCLMILGAKLWAIHRFGNTAPYLDDWAGEGTIIRAYYDHNLSPALIFQCHNEHRIVFTELLSLLLTCVNGQWDNFLEMVA